MVICQSVRPYVCSVEGGAERAGGGDYHIKMTGMLVVPLAVLLLLMVLNIKRSTAGAFVVPFRVLSRNNMTGDNVLCKNLYLLVEKKNSSHTHKKVPWYSLRVLFKVSDEHPRIFFILKSPRDVCPSVGQSVHQSVRQPVNQSVRHSFSWSVIKQ